MHETAVSGTYSISVLTLDQALQRRGSPTREATLSSTPSTPLKDILDEAQAKVTVGPAQYEAVAAITRVAAQREHRRLEGVKAARKKKKDKEKPEGAFYFTEAAGKIHGPSYSLSIPKCR